MKNKKHVITRTNRAECGAVCQNDRLSAGHIWQTRSHVYGEVKCQAEVRSDVVIPNKLGNSETCQGLRHWRLLSNLKNNFSKPVRNDMVEFGGVTRHPEGDSPKDLQTQNHVITRKNIEQEMQKLVRSDVVIPNKLDNDKTCQGLLRRFVHKNTNNNEISPHNDMIIKTVTNLFPISLSLKKRVDSSPNALALNGYGFALHPLLVRLRMTAFTLAEVLITLGIIGVVAAITIPGLINNYKANKLRTQFLKSYSTIQQAFKLMQEDDVSLDPTTYATYTYYKTFMKYLQAPTDCGLGDKKIYPCAYIRNSADPAFKYYKTLDGANASTSYFDDGQIALQDGTLLMFENTDNTNGDATRVLVSVDLNGVKNPPNRWGYDVFTFQLVDEQIKAMGEKGTKFANTNTYCNLNITNEYNGIACASKAKNDTDYFKWVVKTLK